MEATREELGLLAKIRPPRLEDAALPLDSIKEAFFKAASAVSSSAASVLFPEEGEDEERGCVNDLWQTTKSPTSDAVKGGALIAEGSVGGGSRRRRRERLSLVSVWIARVGDWRKGRREKDEENDEKPILVEDYF
ncbi:hypothetical protein Ancab_012187 [Ancistrocladus abbreviatus]